MSSTENPGRVHVEGEEKERLRGRRVVWSRRRSKPWALPLLVIGALVVAASAVAVTYLVTAHPGKPEPNPGIETQATL